MGASQPLPTDEELWSQYRQGNESALGLIYNRHVKRLYAYGRKFNADQALVKDCIQDLFAELLIKPQSVSDTPSVRNYLMKSLRRKLMAHSLQHAWFTEVPDEYTFGLVAPYEQELVVEQVAQEVAKRIQDAIRQLTPRQQEIIYLKFYHDLDNHAIAEVMSLTYQAVCNLISKAIRAIRDLLSHPPAGLLLLCLVLA